MKLVGGDVFVESATAFRKGQAIAVVRLTVTGEAATSQVFMQPSEARKIGLDLIGAAHASVADALLRTIARSEGKDQDALVRTFRELTAEALP